MQQAPTSTTHDFAGRRRRRHRPEAEAPLRLCLAGALLFAVVAWAVHSAPALTALELHWLHALHAGRSAWLLEAMHAVEALHDAVVVLVLSVGITVLVWRRRGWQLVLLLSITLGGGAMNNLAKGWFQRARPELEALVSASGTAFPSGHTVAATLLAAWVVYATWRSDAGMARRVATVCAAVSVVGLVGMSRIYLGAHYPTDVLAAMFAGTAWACGCIAVYHAVGAWRGGAQMQAAAFSRHRLQADHPA